MLRAKCQRRILPSCLLELIAVSSTAFPIRRSYHTCPPISSDVRPRPLGVDLLSTLTSRTQDGNLAGGFTDASAESHNSRLSSLRFALGSDDPVRLRDAFEDLLKHSSLDALTTRDLEMISRMLHNYLAFCPSVQSVMAGARAMAVKVATKGQLDALRTYLLLHLRCGDIQSVASTYDEFVSFFKTSQTPHADQAVVWSDDPVDKDAVSLAMLDPKPALSRSLDPHSTDMLLTVIAAYATQDRFDDVLDRFILLPTSFHVPASRAKAFCDVHLSHDPALSNKVQVWAQDLVQLRLLSRPSALQNHVSKLANEANISSLLKLYSSTIAGCRNADGKLLMVNRGDPGDGRKRTILSIAVWDIFIQGFFKCNRADLAERLWNDVTELGLSPNPHMWTTMLVGYGRQGQCKAAMAIWNRMLEAGVEPSGHAYGAMIQAFFRARRPLEGFALFQKYKKSGNSPEGHLLHDPIMLPMFNIVLHGLCQNRMDTEAKNVLKDMMDHGPKPDIVSYNTFLRHYGRMGDMKSVASVLRALQSVNIQPDVHSYTTLLSVLYKGGTRDAHTRLIRIMETMGVQPNVAMYSAIIDFFVRQGGQENLRNAAMLLQLMENHPDKECRPNEITYTGILAGLHRDPTIPAQDVKSYTESLFAQMHKNGTPPNRTTYHYLIKGSLENPEAQGLQMALGYYREMGKRGIVLTDRTWYVILSSLLRRGDWAIAGEVMSDMFGQGHKPDSALAILVQRVKREISLNS